MFLSSVESVSDSIELGRQLGLNESDLNSLQNEETSRNSMYSQMYEVILIIININIIYYFLSVFKMTHSH